MARAAADAIRALLAVPPRARSPHFSLHLWRAAPVAPELPTEAAPVRTDSVDNLAPTGALYLVVPKRHARRSVTRNLIRRQMRAAVAARPGLCAGAACLLRQRSAFPPAQYPSAASDALRAAVREELAQLLARAERMEAGP